MVDKLTAQLAGRLSFEYVNPMPGFDRSRVKGLVARLVTIKDPAHSTALEVVAGGRLYQVSLKNDMWKCVDIADISSVLLANVYCASRGNIRPAHIKTK